MEDKITVPFIDGSDITLTRVKEDKGVTTYSWSHGSFEGIKKVGAIMNETGAEPHVDFLVENELVTAINYYCENPDCPVPQHNMSTVINMAAELDCSLETVAAVFTAHWVRLTSSTAAAIDSLDPGSSKGWVAPR